MDTQKATSKGGLVVYQDALSMLAADHSTMIELFEEFQSALESESEDQQELAEQICRELEIHSEIEEEIFYPAIGREAALRPLVDEAVLAHGDVRAAIQTIRSLDASDSAFGSTMLQMIEEVERHIEEEENVMFPEIERHLDDELMDLGARLDERKRELQGPQR